MLKKAILLCLALHVCISGYSKSWYEDSCTGKTWDAFDPLRGIDSCFILPGVPSSKGWDLFATVKFNPQFFKDLNEYYLIPSFDSRIKSYEGKQLTLEGYYIPMDLESRYTIILSKNPYSQCFFCGGGGPESVAEIIFSSKPRKFKADQIIKITGTLRLNEKDIDHMNFILENARIQSN